MSAFRRPDAPLTSSRRGGGSSSEGGISISIRDSPSSPSFSRNPNASIFAPCASNVIRSFLMDWCVVVGMGILLALLNLVSPFHRVILKDELDWLKYPFLPNTISTSVLMVCAGLVPLISIIISWFLLSRNRRDVHQSLLGLFCALTVTGLVTEMLKLSVGRPRPDFFWRCFPDGIAVFQPDLIGDVNCTGLASDIAEGRKSFPSGHASWSFAGLGYLSLYLAGKLHVFDGHAFLWRFWIGLAPLFLATYIALTRISDYWHHWQDVFVGAFLGCFFAWAAYRLYYPSIFSSIPSAHLSHRYEYSFPQSSNSDVERGSLVAISQENSTERSNSSSKYQNLENEDAPAS